MAFGISPEAFLAIGAFPGSIFAGERDLLSPAIRLMDCANGHR